MNSLPPAPRPDPLADALAAVATARQALAEAADDPVMRRDPFRKILGSLMLHLDAQAALAVANARAAAPLPSEELQRQWQETAGQAGAAEMKRQAGRLVRSMDGLRMTILVAAGAALFVLGVWAGYALR